MSRRARRKKGAGKNPWLGKLLVTFGVLAILISGAGYLALRAYLSSEGFRDLLSAKVGAAAMVEGEFSSLEWDGLAVETDGFQGKGKGLIENLDVKRIATEIGFGGLTRGVWLIKATRIDRLQIDLNTVKSEIPEPVAPKVREKKVTKKQPGWVPTEVELKSLDIANMGLSVTNAEGTTSASGMAVSLQSVDGENAYEAEIQGGVVLFPQEWLPELRIKRISGTHRDGSLFIDDAEASVWEAGRMEAVGEADFKEGFHALEGSLSGVKCDEILSESWAKRLTGDVASTFTVSNRTGRNVANGELAITNGVLTALPMLDALAAYADTRRFRVLQLNEARTKWRFAEDEIYLSDLVLGSEGLIQLEGNISIRGEQIDGQFQLGIVPGVLSRIPGAETDVFRPGRFGLLWAPIRVTGTLSDPKEDLTPRLIDAAGMRMFELLPESGEQVLKYTRNMLGETPEEAIENSRKLIEDGERAIKDAEQIIKGFRDILGR
jgi:hypothetical protein